MVRSMSYWKDEPNMVHSNNAEKNSKDFGKIVASALGIIFVVGMIVAGLVCRTAVNKRAELEAYQTQQTVEELNEFMNSMK